MKNHKVYAKTKFMHFSSIFACKCKKSKNASSGRWFETEIIPHPTLCNNILGNDNTSTKWSWAIILFMMENTIFSLTKLFDDVHKSVAYIYSLIFSLLLLEVLGQTSKTFVMSPFYNHLGTI